MLAPRAAGALALATLLVATLAGCGDDSRRPPPDSPTGPSGDTSQQPFYEHAFPQVWSSNAYDGQSYEFKSNCGSDFVELETCFLWPLTAVIVEGPDGTQYHLNKDFNINAYSGEVTRRWVLYGPIGAGLMPAGDYHFLYYEGDDLLLTHTVSYTPELVGHPTDIVWTREGDDLVIDWTPPPGTQRQMHYKVLMFPDGGSVISEILPWDASGARLPNIPLADGATGTLNVAIYFSGGYAPSQYLSFTW